MIELLCKVDLGDQTERIADAILTNPETWMLAATGEKSGLHS